TELPAGVSVEHQAFVHPDSGIAAYKRSFDVTSAAIGASELQSLESDVFLYRIPAEASSALADVEEYFTPAHARALTRAFTEGGGGAVKASAALVTPARRPRLGDEALEIAVTFR